MVELQTEQAERAAWWRLHVHVPLGLVAISVLGGALQLHGSRSASAALAGFQEKILIQQGRSASAVGAPIEVIRRIGLSCSAALLDGVQKLVSRHMLHATLTAGVAAVARPAAMIQASDALVASAAGAGAPPILRFLGSAVAALLPLIARGHPAANVVASGLAHLGGLHAVSSLSSKAPAALERAVVAALAVSRGAPSSIIGAVIGATAAFF